MEVLLVIVAVAVVAAFVAVPFRPGAGGERGTGTATEDPGLADLEARKQAKYREIRDTELDHAQGKLGEGEFRRQDAELRGEAIEILRLIDDYAAPSSDSTGSADSRTESPAGAADETDKA